MLHRGYDVWISDADDCRIPEYNMEVEGADGKTVACYIPSESGKRFIIHWKDHNGQHHTSFKCLLDGKWAGANTCRPNNGGSRIGLRTTTNKDSYSPYQFADLRTTEDETALWAAGSLEKLGTIEVRAVRIHAHTRTVPFRPSSFHSVDAVHERSKKLGAHCVTLGATVSHGHGKSAEQCFSTPLYPHEGSYATFIFRYRPTALLQAQGIIPPAAPAFGQSSGAGKGKARAHSDELSMSGPSHIKPEKSRGKDEVKAELARASGSNSGPGDRSVQSDIIELFDSDYDEVDVKPVIHRSGGARRVKPERVEADPDDVIDLTLDD
ncbi:hypothetical protein VTO73DRAFT_10804 [Trametes versicolor]